MANRFRLLLPKTDGSRWTVHGQQAIGYPSNFRWGSIPSNCPIAPITTAYYMGRLYWPLKRKRKIWTGSLQTIVAWVMLPKADRFLCGRGLAQRQHRRTCRAWYRRQTIHLYALRRKECTAQRNSIAWSVRLFIKRTAAVIPDMGHRLQPRNLPPHKRQQNGEKK